MQQRHRRGRSATAVRRARPATTSRRVKACTRAGTSCGSLRPAAQEAARRRLARRGSPSSRRCASTSSCSRAELFDVVRVRGITHVQRAHRRASAPGAAATSASPPSPRSSPRSNTATSSTASRRRCRTPTTTSWPTCRRTAPTRWCRGSPAARSPRRSSSSSARSPSDFGLYTKITGGQRIDLFGARVEQLPGDLAAAGRRRLRVRARLRQGAAHGEVVRRLDLVPLRRAGLGRHGHRARAALPRPALPRTSSSSASPAAPASAPRPAARTSASSPPRTAGTSTSAATAASRPRHAELLAERPRRRRP